jgi:hypothetical protein
VTGRRSRPPSNDNREERGVPPGEEIKLEGDGPFELPLVVEVEIAVGEVMAILELTTVDGKIVLGPLGAQTVAEIHELTGQALDVFGPDEGDTVQ